MIQIELDRFWTADEIRDKYQIPAVLFAKLLPGIPWHYEDEKGVRYFLESRVDSFLHEWAERSETTKVRSGDSQLPDGPQPPDSFYLDGRKYTNISRRAWLLLKTLWEPGAGERVHRDEVMEAVYGMNYDQTVDALDSLRKRLNRVLADQRCPAEVMNRGHYLWIETFPVPTR
jgi:hypothetical protein